MSASTIHGTQRSDGDPPVRFSPGTCTLGTVGSGAASGPRSTRRRRGPAVRRGPAGSGVGAGIEIVGTTAHRLGPGFLLGRLGVRRPQPLHATAGNPPRTRRSNWSTRLGRRYRAAVRSTGPTTREPGHQTRIRPSRGVPGAAAGSPGESATSSPPGSPALLVSVVASAALVGTGNTDPDRAVGAARRAGRGDHRLARVRRPAQGPRVARGRFRPPGRPAGQDLGATTCGGSSPASACSWPGFRRSCCSRRCTARSPRQEAVRIAARSTRPRRSP